MSVQFDRLRRVALGMMAEQEPFEVWQHQGADRGYRKVGTMRDMPRHSTSGIFTIRAGDFCWGEIDGKRVILAAWNICPGDWACVPGFVKLDGTIPEPSKFAKQYDELQGPHHLRIENLINDALK